MHETATQHARVRELERVKEISANERYYFGYQYGLGAQHLVPYLRGKGVNFAHKNICEIGCGEGGVLAALADQGAAYALGIDIRQEAIDRAEIIFHTLFPTPKDGSAAGMVKWDFGIHDVTNQPTPPKWHKQFDFATLRDVIEHLDDTEGSLRHVMEFLRPGGYLYIVFPPYYSPFGGHQHLLKNRSGKLPFLQYLPDAFFKPLIRSGRVGDIEEVMRLRTIRLTIGKFRAAVKNIGLEIVDEQLYFLRPVFKLKFGLPTIKINAFRRMPGIREVAALEAGYLLRMPNV